MSDLLRDTNTSQRIKGILGARGATLKDLSMVLSVTPQTIYSRMASDDWSIEDIKKIAAEYNVDPRDLI